MSLGPFGEALRLGHISSLMSVRPKMSVNYWFVREQRPRPNAEAESGTGVWKRESQGCTVHREGEGSVGIHAGAGPRADEDLRGSPEPWGRERGRRPS